MIDFVSRDDGHVLREAIVSCNAIGFQANIKSQLIEILSNLGCTQNPPPSNIKQLIFSIPKYLSVCHKPRGIVYTLKSGDYHKFWSQLTIERFLIATPTSVLKLTEEPELMNASKIGSTFI